MNEYLKRIKERQEDLLHNAFKNQKQELERQRNMLSTKMKQNKKRGVQFMRESRNHHNTTLNLSKEFTAKNTNAVHLAKQMHLAKNDSEAKNLASSGEKKTLMEEVEKRKALVMKNRQNVLGDLNFFAGEGNKSGILTNLNELHRIKQDEQGLLEFYKAKGMRPSLFLKKGENNSSSSQPSIDFRKRVGASVLNQSTESLGVENALKINTQHSISACEVPTVSMTLETD